MAHFGTFEFESCSPGRPPIRYQLATRKRPAAPSAAPSLPAHANLSAGTVVVVNVVDDEVQAAEASPEVTMPERWSPRLQERKRSKPLTFPTQQERASQRPAALLAQLSVVELDTSGHNNNCLWFSVQRATGQLTAASQHTEAAERASDTGRAQIHKELLRALPAAANAAVLGTNDVWWAGFSRTHAQQVYEEKHMMCEAHVFACASWLNLPIVVVDTRKRAAVIRLYRPGYVVKGLDITAMHAKRLHTTEPQCIWVRLHGVHFTALVAAVECE